nr:reverse transcriptase domain-containing protein [Tanacetum cinerariifolium]
MADTTPIVTTVTKNATKEKTSNEAEIASRINILDFYEEHYKDILPVIDKIRRDKRRKVHIRLDFRENSRKSQRMREDSQNASVETLSARYRNPLESPQVRDRLRNNNGNVFGRRPEDHVKKFQFAAQVERWAMPTWCHMFNSTLIGTARVWFYELPPESIDGYTNLKAAFLGYFMQQKKYVKDPMEIHKIKQKDGETIEEFIDRFKIETGRMKGAPECMRISGFMHGVNNPELIKRLNERVLKTLEEMMTVIVAFIRGETAVASKKKVHTPWKSQDQSKRQNSETPKEIFTAESGKFKPPPPMVTPVEKRSSNKLCEFYNDKGHSIDECVQLRKQIEKLRVTRQKVTQSFTHVKEITFPPLTVNKGTRGPLVIEAEISGHAVHRIYVDKGFSMEWGNYMAARTVKALGNYRGHRALNKSMGELHDSEVTITIQRILTIRSTILTPTECTTITVTPKDHVKKAEAHNENFRVAIHPDFPDQEITIKGTPSDMTGVPQSIAEHRLNIREGYSTVRQKKRGQASERAKAIQVEMAEQDEENTAFHTSHGIYCYIKMPFGLKNAGATYQRLVGQAFDKQIDRNLKIHVEDLVIKSHTETDLLRDIKETFRTLRKNNMKLNPKSVRPE